MLQKKSIISNISKAHADDAGYDLAANILYSTQDDKDLLDIVIGTFCTDQLKHDLYSEGRIDEIPEDLQPLGVCLNGKLIDLNKLLELSDKNVTFSSLGPGRFLNSSFVDVYGSFPNSKLFHTGIYLDLPKDELDTSLPNCALVLPRSGLACKYGVTVANSPGLIDLGYKGEILVGLINHSPYVHFFTNGARIAQLVFIRTIAAIQLLNTKETNRGTGGFGSTDS